MSKTIRAWHFLRADWTAHGGFPVKVGQPYHVGGLIVPCARGLHASVRAIDALYYAPGPVVTLVECSGTIVEHGNPVDKIACSDRVALWGYDAIEELCYFARQCALEVIHLWDAPAVVRKCLETGDAGLRVAAPDAADAAARAASHAASHAAYYAARATYYAANATANANATYYAARAASHAANAAYYAANAAHACPLSECAKLLADASAMLESLLMDGAVRRGLL
jgi:hypothetical protein